MNNFIIPIPPLYRENEELNTTALSKYLNYLELEGATVVMTTAGTSQFNLLNESEIIDLNNCVNDSSIGKKILGIPGVNTYHASCFARNVEILYSGNDFNQMAIYPDRYYDYESIYSYLSEIRSKTSKPLYLHAMFMRNGTGGTWDYDSDTVNRLFDAGVICGIKEEHTNLQSSFNFIKSLHEDIDVIVAGGSMRRHSFLKHAGANSFLSGVGNFFPDVENKYIEGDDSKIIVESKLFDVFNKYGWHRSLRCGLKGYFNFGTFDRMPWPKEDKEMVDSVLKVLMEINDER